MSSGDPLVDQDAQRLEALNSLLAVLTASADDGNSNVVLEAAPDSDDPLAATAKEAQEKRDAMLDAIKGNGPVLVAVDDSDPMVEADAEDAEARNQLIQQLKDTSFVAQQEPDRKTVEDALRAMNDYANMDHGQLLAADAVGVNTGWFEHRSLEAAGGAQSSNHSSAMDLPQLLAGAFVLVAAVALVAIAKRRRKSAPSETADDAGHGDYQLFM
jgi:hypothetical protein